MNARDRAPDSPEGLYADFRARRSRGEAIEFEDFVSEHPDLETALRILHDGELLDADSAVSTVGPSTAELLFERAASALTDDEFPGDLIGSYRLSRLLGEGGMGRVFLAEQEGEIRRSVALKIIRPGMASDEILQRFHAERQALARLNHDGICRVYDAGRTPSGEPYFVMELVDGDRLLTCCSKRGLDTWSRLELFIRICDAVQHAHDQGVMHRDIKPANVLVKHESGVDQPKIIDFGLARALSGALSAESDGTLPGQILGTIEYMSPEQARMDEGGIDGRSDVFSLGATLYELLAGTPPVSRDVLLKGGWTAIPANIESTIPPSPSSRVAERLQRNRQGGSSVLERRVLRTLKGDLDWIVLKALERNPRHRYATPRELADDLRRFLRCEPTRARPPSRIRDALRFARRHAAASIAVVVAVVAAALVSLLVSLWSSYESERRGQELVADGRELFEEFVALKGREAELHEAWRDRLRRSDDALPVWERKEELEAWKNRVTATARSDDVINEINRKLYQAFEILPRSGSIHQEARDLLARLNLALYREADERGNVSLGREYFADRVLEYGGEEYRGEFEGGALLRFTTDPPDASVHCFRYVEDDYGTRLIPESLHAEAPAAGLLVEKVWPRYASKSDPPPFRSGDRLLSVNSVQTSTLEELAGSLSGLMKGATVSTRVLGPNGEETRSWIPFANDVRLKSLPPGHLVDSLLQLGLTFASGSPEIEPESEVGVTRADAPFELRLPRGEYLFIFRRDGHLPARYPVVTAGSPAGVVSIDLVPSSAIPDGFIHVPAGAVSTGGDAGAFQSERWGSHMVDAFLIGRFEVTVGEWLEFINDAAVLERTDLEGWYEPADPDIRQELSRYGESRISLFGKDTVDRGDGTGWWSRGSAPAPWRFDEEHGDLEWPAFGVCHFAAREYCLWRTRRSSVAGSPHTFRLPADREWERAARGVDRREFAWGNYLVWSYCRSFRANRDDYTYPVGSAPIDESPFGLRDVTGSCSEHTLGQPVAGRAYRSIRGGDWVESYDDFYFRLASRNTRYPEDRSLGSGFRVVMDVPRRTSDAE